ncbi:MAG: ATP-binding protein [Gammaproteobacteria bacterium]|nr:ATP-binding protein [Gammaproteobacteria bacterium]
MNPQGEKRPRRGVTARDVFLRRLIAAVLLIDLFVASMVLWSLQESRTRQEEQAAVAVGNLSRVLERDIAGTIARVDLALFSVSDEYMRQQGAEAARAASITRFIARLRAHLPEVDALRFTDARGVVVYGSDTGVPESISPAELSSFSQLRDEPRAGLLFSLEQHPAKDKWFITLARRMTKLDGSFAGVAFAPVPLERFSREFSAIDIGRYGSISLRDRQQRILSRYPVPAAPVIGQPLIVPQLQALIGSGESAATYISNRTVDGVERRFSVRRIADYPLYIVVGRSIQETLASWRNDMNRDLSVLALFFIGTFAASKLIYEAWRRQAAAAEEVRVLNDELEQRVKARTAELEAANKELEEFSYSISHDLLTPLRAIASFSQILVEEYASAIDAEGKRLLAIIRDNTVQMGLLIDNILEFIRLGRRPMDFHTVDMSSLVRDVIKGFHAQIAHRQVRFSVAELPVVIGDRMMLRKLMESLISNSIKFTRDRTEAVIEIGCRAEEVETVFFVKDNGRGFDMRYADKLFKVFEKIHPKDQFEGTGTGLAMVKRIAVRHGGRVWAEGEVDVGATISFTLPAKPNGPPRR